jgi:AcrR family transcriptional regulator
MTAHQRRARERAERERTILATARSLAEAEGWDAVTTRRLADAIEYSQPVLYSHFPDGKAGIAAALALEGVAEMGEHLRRRRGNTRTARNLLIRLAEAYLEFAEQNPVLYQIIFTAPTTLIFADEASPAPLRAAFSEIVTSVTPVAGDHDPQLVAEVFWSALHGLATLDRDGRLSRDNVAARTRVLVDSFVDVHQ